MSIVVARRIPDPLRSLLRLQKQLREVWEAIDEGKRAVERDTGRPICVADCGLCCQRMTPAVTKLEAEYIASNLPKLGNFDEVQSRVLDWLTAEDARIDHHNVPEGVTLTPHEANQVRQGISLVERSRCPLLSDQNRCLIYEFRPLVCRAYGITGVDEWCPRPLSSHEFPKMRSLVRAHTPLGQQLSRLMDRLRQQMVEYLREDLLTLSHLPMFLAWFIAQDKVQSLRSSGKIPQARAAISNGTIDFFAMK